MNETFTRTRVIRLEDVRDDDLWSHVRDDVLDVMIIVQINNMGGDVRWFNNPIWRLHNLPQIHQFHNILNRQDVQDIDNIHPWDDLMEIRWVPHIRHILGMLVGRQALEAPRQCEKQQNPRIKPFLHHLPLPDHFWPVSLPGPSFSIPMSRRSSNQPGKRRNSQTRKRPLPGTR
jgi:hypothetical protein